MKWVLVVLFASACHRATPASSPRCDDPCLFLTDTAIDQAGSAYHAACSAKPVPDYTACSVASYNRACIAAAHGVVSKKDSQLEPVFAAKPWFKKDPAFKLDTLSQVEKDNRAALLGTAKCKMPNEADLGLALAWVHKLPALAAAPAETYVHDDPTGDHKVTAAQLVAYLSSISANGKQVALDTVFTDGVPTASNHYYVAGQSDPVPSFAKLVEARPELRVLELEIYSPVDRDNKLIAWHPDGADDSGGTGTAMALDEAKMGEHAEGQYKMQHAADPPAPDDGSAAKPYTPPAYHIDTKIWLALDASNAIAAIGAMHAVVTESTDTGR
jgi:hypothetical protein